MTSVDDQIRKKFGDTAIRTLGETRREKVEVAPTGILAFDLATDVGGFPRGRITEIFGWEGSFKTSMALKAVAGEQKLGKRCLYIDLENALDPAIAKMLGVDVDSLSISQPDSAEQALDIVELVSRTNEYSMIVLDSVASLVPSAEAEAASGEMKMGLTARLMSQHLRKVSGPIRKNNIVMVYINQMRMKIGTAAMYGDPATTTGGKALGFAASMRVRMSLKEKIKNGKEIIGLRFKAVIAKNKVGTPLREAEFAFYFDSGVNQYEDLVDIASDLDVITKRGAFYLYGDQRLGQGIKPAALYLEEHEEMFNEIMEQTKKLIIGSPAVSMSDDDEVMEVEE